MKTTPDYSAYDYDTQKWVSCSEAQALLKRQLTLELNLLTGPNAADYLKFSGSKMTLEQAVSNVQGQLVTLSSNN